MLLIAWEFEQLVHNLRASDHGEKTILCSCLNMVITITSATLEYFLVWYGTSKATLQATLEDNVKTTVHSLVFTVCSDIIAWHAA